MNPAQLVTVCPKCGGTAKVKQEMIGQFVRCFRCKHRFELLSINSASSDVQSTEWATSVGESSSLDDQTSPSTLPQSVSATASPSSTSRGSGQLGRFRLQKVLGQGGFGKVYRAYDPQLDRLLAIKVPTFSNDDTKRIERFLTEARAAANLRHPNIVPTFESGKVDGRYFIASQFIDGQPLNEVIKTGAYDRTQAIQWIVDLADALAYSHANHIVHRDVKPHNVMIDATGLPQLMDFGLARRGGEESTQTIDGVVLGTPAYMPPEQARGELSKIGPHSDQYSLGVILYELLTGRRPFQGESHAVIYDVIHSEPSSTRKVNPSIRKDLDAICRKSMAKESQDRFANCAEFAEDLRRWLRGDSTRARPLSVVRQFSRWVRKNPVLGAAAVVCLAAVGSFGILASAVAINQRQRNEVAEEALGIAEQRKTEALQANSILANNELVLKQSLSVRDEAIRASELANQQARDQTEIAEQERQFARRGLLSIQLQKLHFEKQELLIGDAIGSLNEALTTAQELGANELAQGLAVDRDFLRWIHPTSLNSGVQPAADKPTDVARIYLPMDAEHALLHMGSNRWQLTRTTDGQQLGQPITLIMPEGRASESVAKNGVCLHAWISAGKELVWITAESENDMRFLNILQRHTLNLGSGDYAVNDGPRFMPVAVAAMKLPVWFGPTGKKLAYRSLENATEIVVADAANFRLIHKIESALNGFERAAFNLAEDRLAIVNRDDKGRYSLILHPCSAGAGRSKTVALGSDYIHLHSEEDLAMALRGRLTEIRSLEDGQLQCTLPINNGQIVARPHKGGPGLLLSGRDLLLWNADRGEQRTLDLSSLGSVLAIGPVIGGMVHCEAVERDYTLDLPARLIVDCKKKEMRPLSILQSAEKSPFQHENSRQIVPDGDWRLVKFIDSQRALLVQSEVLDRYQVLGRFVLQHEVDRYTSFGLLDLSQFPATSVITEINGLVGQTRIVSVAAGSKKLEDLTDKENVISAEQAQRLAAAGNSITLSSSGKFSVVREVQQATSLAIYNLHQRSRHGQSHLTETLLVDQPLSGERSATRKHDSTSSQVRGQVRFNPTDELFVYRINSQSFGIVLAETGKRIGPTLAISDGRIVHEVGWSFDSKYVWAATSKPSGNQRIDLWSVVDGRAEVCEINFHTAVTSAMLSSTSARLLLQSITGELAVFDTTSLRILQLEQPAGSQSGAGETQAGFWGLDESIFQFSATTASRAFRVSSWKAGSTKPDVISSNKDTIVLPLLHGRIAMEGSCLLSEASLSPASSIRLVDLEDSSKVQATIRSQSGFISIVVAPFGNAYLTVEVSGEVQLWHAVSGVSIGPPLSKLILWPPQAALNPGGREFRFSPDGRHLFVSFNSKLVTALVLPEISLESPE